MKGIRYRVFALATLVAIVASLIPLGRVGPIGSQPASAANLSWETLTNLPSGTGCVVPSAAPCAAPAAMSKVVVSPNYASDRTIFGIDRTVVAAGVPLALTGGVWKSSDGGTTWQVLTITNVTAPVFGLAQVVDIAISPQYGTGTAPNQVVAVALDDPAAGANASQVFQSNDGGLSWTRLAGLSAVDPLAAGGLATTEQLSSVDIGIDTSGGPVIAVGAFDTGAGVFAAPSVLVYGVGVAAWANPGAANLAEDVTAVKFSSNFASDRIVLAVGSLAAAPGTRLHSVVFGAAWDALGAGVVPLAAGVFDVGTAPAIVRSYITVPSDFNALNSGRRTVFVATNSNGVLDNVYRATVGSATQATGIGPGAIAYDGLAVSGTIQSGAGTMVAGVFTANLGGLIAVTSNTPYSGFPTWVQNTVVAGDTSAVPPGGAPAGLSAYADLAPNFATSSRVVASTFIPGATIYIAAAQVDTGFSVSDNGGTNYRQVSNIASAATTTAAGATWRGYSFSPNFANDNTIFAWSTDGGALRDSLWRSTDGGQNWARVFAYTTATQHLSLFYSPSFATDRTMYFRDTASLAGGTAGTRFYQSTDGGTSWNAVSTAPTSSLSAHLVLSATQFLVGLNDGTTRMVTINPTTNAWNWGSTTYSTFNPPLTIGATVTGEFIAIVRRGTTNDLVASIANGDVYLSTDLGVTFNRLGSGPAHGTAGAIPVAGFSADYATDSYVYSWAAIATTNTAIRWKVGSSTTWEAFCGNAAATADILPCATGTGTFIAYSGTFAYLFQTGAFVAGPGGLAVGGVWSTTNLNDLATRVTFSQLLPGTGGTNLIAANAYSFLAIRALPNNAGRQFFLRNSTPGPDTIVTLTDTIANLAGGVPVPVAPANGAFGVGSADPANTAVVQGSSIVASWNPVAGATSYRVQLSTAADFPVAGSCAVTLVAGAPPTNSANLGGALGPPPTGVACPIPGLTEPPTVNGASRVAGQTYFWRVRVETPTVGVWSATQSFVTALVAPAAVGLPIPVQPNVASAIQDASVRNQVPTIGTLFVWTGVSFATFYELQVSTDATFSDQAQIAINATGALALGNQLAYVSTVPLKPGTTYFWRVRGVTTATVGGWSPATAFTTASTGAALTVAEATASIAGAYDIIWVYDNPTQSWKSYTPGAPAFANTLASVMPGTPVWIKANRVATWTRGTGSVSLVAGWNLVVAP